MGSGRWLGFWVESSEILTGTYHGVVKCRMVGRKAMEIERWGRISVVNLKGTSWEPEPGSGMEVAIRLRRWNEEEIAQGPRNPQGVPQIQRAYWFKIPTRTVSHYGPSLNCTACESALWGGKQVGHKEHCWERFAKSLADDGAPRAFEEAVRPHEHQRFAEIVANRATTPVEENDDDSDSKGSSESSESDSDSDPCTEDDTMINGLLTKLGVTKGSWNSVQELWQIAATK